jgi:hypothetical protein
MNTVGPLILAILIGAVSAVADLLTSDYNTTMSFVLRRSIALYSYALIHGVISGVAFMIFPHFVSFRIVDDRISRSPWIWALVAGIFTRSLLQLNLFTIGTGPTTIKVGLRSLVNLFEPKLLRDILLDEFNAVRAFVKPYANAYSDLVSVKERIEQAVPNTLSEPEKQAFLSELQHVTNVTEAMEKFLRFAGRADLAITFALSARPAETARRSG